MTALHRMEPPPENAAQPDGAGTLGISVRDLALRYGQNTIFEGLSFDIEPGHFVALLGSSGVGKTSLLKIIAGLETAAAGSVVASDGGQVASRIAYMGQQDLLYPWLTVRQNVTLGARLRGEKPELERADHLLERVGLGKHATALPMMLSGGMRQRAAIARTLYEQRPFVLMDEPFSALDALTRDAMGFELLRLWQASPKTVMFITHSIPEAVLLADRVVVMSARPGGVIADLPVPLGRPRDETSLRTAEMQDYMAHLRGLLIHKEIA